MWRGRDGNLEQLMPRDSCVVQVFILDESMSMVGVVNNNNNLYVCDANFSRNRMHSIQAFIFSPRAPKFRVVARNAEEMV